MTGGGIFRRRLAPAYAVFAAVLLAIQSALAFFPSAVVGDGGTIEMVICGPGGVETVALDLATGETERERAPVTEAKCPFGVLCAAAVFAPPFRAPARAAVALRAPPEMRGVAAPAPAPLFALRPIRAPPLTA